MSTIEILANYLRVPAVELVGVNGCYSYEGQDYFVSLDLQEAKEGFIKINQTNEFVIWKKL